MPELEGELGTVIMDDDRNYRYHLTRDFGAGEGRIAFIMLNPSKANHHCDDRTVERCSAFARDQGYQVLEVGNLYAQYGTEPRDLQHEPPPIVQLNNAHLCQIATRCPTVVAAWGDMGEKPFGRQQLRNRANHVLQLIWEAMENAEHAPMIHRLGQLTKKGHPRHPSRLGDDNMCLVEWTGAPPQV